MTKLTTERLDKLQDNLLQFQDAYSDPADKENYDIFVDALHVLDEFKAAKEKLLAYEQAAEHPAARITWDGSEFSVSNVSEDFLYGGTAVYLAPVLPKQPELIGMKVSIDTVADNIGHRLFGEIVGTSDSNGVPVLCIEVTENNDDMAAPAQPVIPDEITSASAPEVFEIAAEAERLGIRGTYGPYAVGWNACRAEMLKAQPVSEPYKLAKSPEACAWISDGEGLWLGDCGLTWTFFDDGPNENGLKYCPSCGKKVSFIAAPAQESE